MSSFLIFKCPMSHGTVKYTLKAHVCYFAKTLKRRSIWSRLQKNRCWRIYTREQKWKICRIIFIIFYSTIRNIKLKIVFKFSKCLSLISTISIYICSYQLLYKFLSVTMNMRDNPKGLGFWCLTPFRLYRRVTIQI
jgi:hypothetical protein